MLKAHMKTTHVTVYKWAKQSGKMDLSPILPTLRLVTPPKPHLYLSGLPVLTGPSLAVPWSSVTPRHQPYLLGPLWILMGLAVAGQARGAAGRGPRMILPRSVAISRA